MCFAAVKTFLPLGELTTASAPTRYRREVRMQSHMSGRFFGVAVIALLLGAVAARAQDTELQFYTSVPRELSAPLAERFTAMNSGIKVNLFEAGAETVLGKMELEIRSAGRIQADVIWLEEPAAVKQFADDGRLEPYASSELENVLPIFRDPQGRFVANQVAFVFIMYNAKKMSSDKAPKSWKDLTDSRFAKQLIFANPRVSGTGATVASAMVQAYGLVYWESIAKLKPILVSGSEGMISTIVQGERLAGPIHNYTIGELLEKKQPIAYVVPTEGGIALPAYVAIARGTPKLEAAKKFYDFMISKEAAGQLVKDGMFSTRTDVPGPKGWPSIGEVKTMPFDWAQHARAKAEIKAKFADLMEK